MDRSSMLMPMASTLPITKKIQPVFEVSAVISRSSATRPPGAGWPQHGHFQIGPLFSQFCHDFYALDNDTREILSLHRQGLPQFN